MVRSHNSIKFVATLAFSIALTLVSSHAFAQHHHGGGGHMGGGHIGGGGHYGGHIGGGFPGGHYGGHQGGYYGSHYGGYSSPYYGGLGFGGLGYSSFSLGFGGLGYGGLGYSGLGYSGLGYSGLGYSGLGYSGLGYSGLGYGGLGYPSSLGVYGSAYRYAPAQGYYGSSVPSYTYRTPNSGNYGGMSPYGSQVYSAKPPVGPVDPSAPGTELKPGMVLEDGSTVISVDPIK